MMMMGRGEGGGGALLFNTMLSLMTLFSEIPTKKSNFPKIWKDRERIAALIASNDMLHPQDVYQKCVCLEKRGAVAGHRSSSTSNNTSTVALLSLHTSCRRPVMLGNESSLLVLTCNMELVSSFSKNTIPDSSSSSWWSGMNKKQDEQLDVFEGLVTLPNICLNVEQDFIISISIPSHQQPHTNYSLAMKECQLLEDNINQTRTTIPTFRRLWSWVHSFADGNDAHFLGTEIIDLQQLLTNEKKHFFLYLWIRFQTLQLYLFMSIASSCILLCLHVIAVHYCCCSKPMFRSTLSSITGDRGTDSVITSNAYPTCKKELLRNMKRKGKCWCDSFISIILHYCQYYVFKIASLQRTLMEMRPAAGTDDNGTPTQKHSQQLLSKTQQEQNCSPSMPSYLIDTANSTTSTSDITDNIFSNPCIIPTTNAAIGSNSSDRILAT